MHIFKSRFVARIFLTSFIGVHVPLLFAAGYVFTRSASVDWTLLAVLTAATLAGTVGTIVFLHKELRPVIRITRSLQEFAEKRVKRPIEHSSDDEIGQLATAAEWAIDTVDELVRRLEREARTDALTGLPNRRAFLEMIEGEALASLALIDIDRFKSINDTHGHETGDMALRNFANVMRAVLGPDDILARWGGEEFILYMPAADPEHARSLLDMARDAVASASLIPKRRVTFSAGVVSMSGSIDVDAAAADELLLAAKKAGRNRVLAPKTVIDEGSADLLDCVDTKLAAG